MSIITLVKKGIKVFLRKAGQLSKIIIDNKLFDLVNIIENQYVIRLIKNPKPAIIN